MLSKTLARTCRNTCLVRDTLGIKRDMEEVGMCLSLWLQRKGSNFVKPTTPYVFNGNEKREFLELVSFIKAPTMYAAAFKKTYCKAKTICDEKS